MEWKSILIPAMKINTKWKKSNTIEALRLCTRALKSTPVCSLQHACNEMPPNVRYLQLCLFYGAHLLTFSEHPTLSVIQDSWFDRFPDSQNYCFFNLLTNNFFAGDLNVHKLYKPCNAF